jgi:hypothetical protein
MTMTFAKHFGRLALATFMGAGACMAQESAFAASFKMRAGAGLSTTDDNLSRKLMGLGFDFTYGTPASRWGLELGYQYKPGNQYLQDPATMATANGAVVDPGVSVDSRKNQMGGLMLRGSWEHQLGAGPWALHGGLQFGGTKWRQEYIGDVSNGLKNGYEDTYNGIASHDDHALSPYAGATWLIDPSQALEMNLLVLNYTSANYVHTAGTMPSSVGGNVAWDVVATRKHTVPTLEFVYVLRF